MAFVDQKSQGGTKKVSAKSTTDGFPGYIGIPERFALINRLITRDLNKNPPQPTFYRYTKDEIATYLADPAKNEKYLRNAVTYIYGASSHFRRLIQYFVGLTDLSYVVVPYRMDPDTVNRRMASKNYRKVCNTVAALNLRTQAPKILTVCLREDVFYGTMHISGDSIIIQQLPSDYCKIQTIENNVPNVTFDFSYFDSRSEFLNFYPEEFSIKYKLYKKNRTNRWIELDAPTSFAVKCNSDILDYATPPFAGLLREIYDIEDYKTLKMSKTALENYALVYMRLGLDAEGNWQIDLDKAKEFWRNLDAVLPEEVGSVLTPMPLDKISFEKSNTGDTNTVAEAEDNLFSAAGVSSLLFNNPKASANALLLSVKADQSITYGIVKGIEDVINRYLHYQGYGKNYSVLFLDTSPFNRKEVTDSLIKGCTSSFPMRKLYWAASGFGEVDMESMNFLETEILHLDKVMQPVKTSSTQSSDDIDSEAATDDGGAPEKDVGDLTESGEQTRDSQ